MWDLTLPGYKYLGPFNSLDKGVPENQNDLIAWLHDLGYTAYEQKVGNKWSVYFVWNEADANAYSKWEDGDYGGKLAKFFFQLKHKLSSTKLLPTNTQSLTDTPIWSERAKQKEEYKSVFKTPSPEKMSAKRLRSVTMDEDEEMQQADTSRLRASSSTTRAKGGIHETPIDPTDWVTRGPKDYAHGSLPYLQDARIREQVTTYDMAFRMTSPYDCVVKTLAPIDMNSNATTGGVSYWIASNTDTTDNVITKARWYDYYGDIYKYYHVKKCRWHATFENLRTEPMWVHQMYYTEDVPPFGATNQDIQLWRDCKSHWVGSSADSIGITGDKETAQWGEELLDEEDTNSQVPNGTEGTPINANGRSSILTLSGSYTPGQAKREVRLDSQVENWTSTSANPALPERLLFRIKPETYGVILNEPASSDRIVNFRFKLKIEYLVEFKELPALLRWPIGYQPATITVPLEADQATDTETEELKY